MTRRNFDQHVGAGAMLCVVMQIPLMLVWSESSLTTVVVRTLAAILFLLSFALIASSLKGVFQGRCGITQDVCLALIALGLNVLLVWVVMISYSG